MTIRDKVEGLRVIPLTPYVSALLAALPRRNALGIQQSDGGIWKAPGAAPAAQQCRGRGGPSRRLPCTV
jgi:hypothetical protein